MLTARWPMTPVNSRGASPVWRQRKDWPVGSVHSSRSSLAGVPRDCHTDWSATCSVFTAAIECEAAAAPVPAAAVERWREAVAALGGNLDPAAWLRDARWATLQSSLVLTLSQVQDRTARLLANGQGMRRMPGFATAAL